MQLLKRRKNTIAVSGLDATKLPAESEDFESAVATFLRRCRVRNLTGHTIIYYTDILTILKRLLAEQGVTRPVDITQAHIEACIVKKREIEEVKDVTIEKYLRGWRAFFNFLHAEGFISEVPTDDVRMKSERRIIETFSRADIQQLLAVPNKSKFTGYRDFVIMLTLLDTGIRVSEAEGILIPNINWKDRVIKVFGKGRKERFVPFQKTLARHLKEYISIRGLLHHDFLFSNIDNKPMKVRAIQENIKNYGIAAGIKGVRVSPHTFRHTFAKYYIMNGGDIFSLQRILGHSTLDMVRRYVNLFGTDVVKQHAKFSPVERLDEDE